MKKGRSTIHWFDGLRDRQPFGIAALDDLATPQIDSDYKEIAAFANVTWHVNDRFDITAGAAWRRTSRSAHQITAGNPIIVGTMPTS